jgi:hypothetical protein
VENVHFRLVLWLAGMFFLTARFCLWLTVGIGPICSIFSTTESFNWHFGWKQRWIRWGLKDRTFCTRCTNVGKTTKDGLQAYHILQLSVPRWRIYFSKFSFPYCNWFTVIDLVSEWWWYVFNTWSTDVGWLTSRIRRHQTKCNSWRPIIQTNGAVAQDESR